MIPLPAIRELLAPAPVVRVPQQDDVWVGVALCRGRALPVVSLASLLGLGTPPPEHEWIVVIDDPLQPLGLLTARPDDVVVVATAELRPRAGRGARLVAATAPDGTPVLDVAALLREGGWCPTPTPRTRRGGTG